MSRHGAPIQDIYLRKQVDSGITLASLAGAVPEFEEREAAVFCQYNWLEWQTLPSEERAASVAHYRLHNLIESHVQDAIQRKMDRQ